MFGEDDAVLVNTEVEDMCRIEIDGIEIHYQILGDGEPVAFLNGVMMTTQSWVLQTALFRHRFRCLVHDFRGQLLSDKPEGRRALEDHVGDLKALVDHLEVERCHLVGTSYGGEVGMIFGYTYPERVKTLSVISSTSEVDEELDRVVTTWAEVAREAPDRLYRTVLPHTFSERFRASDPHIIQQGEERLRMCPPEFFTAFARLVEAFRRLDIIARLPRIQCPTLVVGEDDALKPPRHSRLIASRIAGSELLLVPEAGHAVILEKPDEVNTALLGFLEKHR